MRALMVLVAVALVGCGPSRGMMMTGDGQLVAATPETWRAETERVLADEVASTLPAGVAVEAASIAELPVYGDGRRAPIEGWYFPSLHARIAIRSPRDLDEAAVAATARGALVGKTPRPERIEVVVMRLPATGGLAQPASRPGPRPMTATRSCTAYAGDTLADLSLAFYGTPDLWRLIRDANPAVDFAGLKGGEELVIPPKP